MRMQPTSSQGRGTALPVTVPAEAGVRSIDAFLARTKNQAGRSDISGSGKLAHAALSTLSVALCAVLSTTLVLAQGSHDVSDADKNLKENPYKVETTLPQDVLDHRKLFDGGPDGKGDKTYQAGNTPIYTVHVPGGWAGNVTFIDAGDQVIVYDTTVSKEGAAIALKEIRKVTSDPITTIFYSHHHTDHYNGTSALVSEEDVKSGKVKIYAWGNFVKEKDQEFGELLPRQAMGVAYFSQALLEDSDKPYFTCCGIKAIGGTPGYIPPTHLIDKEQTLKIGNLELRAFYTGGEAISEFGIHIPKYDAVILADEFFYSIPNAHSIRTSKPRIPDNYIKAMDRTIALDPEHLLGSHIVPIEGKKKIREHLVKSRDALQYLWDQSVRYINKGYGPMELQQKLGKLPKHLASFPYNVPAYGDPRTMVPEFYTGWVSWFNGDPIDLVPLPRQDFAEKIVDAMGGRQEVLKRAERAFNDKDYQFAGRLAAYLVSLNTDDMRARYLKASALRALGHQQFNGIMRSWYLTSALELEGKIDTRDVLKATMKSIQPTHVSDEKVFQQWRYMVDAEKAASKDVSSCLYVKDAKRYWDLRIRNGVFIARDSEKQNCDDPISLTMEELRNFDSTGKLPPSLALGGARNANGSSLESIYALLDRSIPRMGMSLK